MNSLKEPTNLFEKIRPDNPDAEIIFAEEILGLPVSKHRGQVKWLTGANRVVNILRPGNQWGKTLAIGIRHLYKLVTKDRLHGRVATPAIWRDLSYETANVGKTYEVARGVFEVVQDLAEGRILLPGGQTNDSLLKGWAITDVRDTQSKPPYLDLWNGSRLLIRSYDEFGAAFKRKKLAYVSADECGDIPELKLFLTGTLLPRVSFFKGQVDLIGTPQPQGVEYIELAEEAELNMQVEKEGGQRSTWYFQRGSIFENPFMDARYIKQIEETADPELRRQIIYGEHVDYADHYFNFDEVSNIFSSERDWSWNPQTGRIEDPVEGARYVFPVDLSAGADETVITGIRYGKTKKSDGMIHELPYEIVFQKAFTGKTIPLSMQYQLIVEWFSDYAEKAHSAVLVYDAHTLGGKNAKEAFAGVRSSPFPPKGYSPGKAKTEALARLKEVMSRGRRVVKDPLKDRYVDLVPDWGFIKAPKDLKILRKQLETYRVEDKYIRQDRVMTVMMGVHYIEIRKPKLSRNKAVGINMLGSTAV